MHMPLGLLQAYAGKIAQLQAEETLRSIHAQVAASGHMKKSDLDRYLKSLKREAEGGRRKRSRNRATPEQIARMNIKTERG
jgi:hypothetical protein